MLNKINWLCFHLLLLACCLFAQEVTNTPPPGEKVVLGLSPDKAISQYQCDQWNKVNGLPQNSVFSILQSDEGYIWLGTYDGLVRFDGLDFKPYTTNNIDELRSSGIWALYEDSEKNLWIGTANGGLTQYKNGRFRTFTTEDGLPSNAITCIQEDQQQNLWIGTRKGLSLFKNNTFKNFGTQDGLSARHITALYSHPDGSLWVGTNRGLTVYKNEKFEDYSRNKILFINRSVTSITKDSLGKIWIGTHTGLVRWDEKYEQYKIFRISDGLTDDYITKVFVDSRGTLWIGTQSVGLNRIIADHLNEENPPISTFTDSEGLTANSISELYEDREGSLWIGLNRGGLNRLRDGKFTNFTSIEGLPDDVTNCVYQDQQDRIWVGTLSGGVSYLENDTFNIINQAKGISSNHIRSVLEDQNGDIWLATYSNGINRIQYSLNKENPPILHYTMNDGLAGNIVRSLFRCQDGGILVGTNGGLSKFDGKSFVNYTRQIGLSENSILGLYEDSKGNIWIGTDGGGLNCLRTDNTIISYSNSSGLASNLVFTIYEDQDGAIWIGSRRGLSRILDGEIVNLYAKDGLAQEAIHGIIEDDYGRMWFSSNSGVFWVLKKELDAYANQKFDPKKDQSLPPFQSTLYQEDDGMKSSDCATAAQPSILKDHQGFIWFPTTEGVTRIDPAHLKINYITPKVQIKRILIDNEEYPIQEERLVLDPGKTKFEIDYAALSFLAPAKVKYRYRLEGSGFKEDWVEAGNRRDAYYNNLPPGNYTFRVQAANNDGVWNEEGAAISFYLKPFFYQTRLFYIVSILLFLSLAFGIYYWRVRSLERSKKALEKGIEESTQKIRSQYHELTQYAEELSTINNIVTTINKEHKFEKVLESLLDQGLLLFSKSNKGLFIVQNPDTKVFHIAACQGYDQDSFDQQNFSKNQLMEYCATGLQLEKEIYKLQPSINLKPLMKVYRPKSSLAMQILENDELRGVLFFDNSTGFQDVQMSDILKLTRFKEQAVSAFVKARILRELENKNYQVETSFRKISDSIRYARRIQRAILPSEQEIENARVFEDLFIFYKPRDIVSGDFYWYAETSPEPIFSLGEKTDDKTSVFKGFDDIKKIITAVDCTGHGVPGAFMTVIGNDLLNSIVNEDKITRAHHILDRLDKNVRMYLKQEEGGQSRDGMDMSLLVIDEINQKIEFAGAKNPLYYVSEGELIQIKASKHPIGGSQIKNKVFTSAEIDYKSGDVFYLFSDGFPDQFGGPDDRKYGSKRFRELLIRIHQLPLTEQKQIIIKEFETWKGHNKQTDDILVMGLKF